MPYRTKLERLSSGSTSTLVWKWLYGDKHSSLLSYRLNYDHKKFYDTVPRRENVTNNFSEGPFEISSFTAIKTFQPSPIFLEQGRSLPKWSDATPL
jgi:hypothetical protein